MIVEKFLKWVDSAKVVEREAAASALARAYLQSDLTIEERCAAEAALAILLDDPSPIVRLALADTLSTSVHAPVHIVTALAADQPEIASRILVRSPVLADTDIIDRIALGSEEIQCVIALRPQISSAVAAAMAEVGCAEACKLLIGNEGAKIAPVSFRRIVERFGDKADVRDILMDDLRLPVDARQILVVKVSRALSDMPMVKALIGSARAERITREAVVRASLDLIDECGADEHAALVEHLRLSGALTTAFVLRVMVHGKIGFLATILAALSSQDEDRIKAQLAGGRVAVLTALFSRCGFTSSVGSILVHALDCWRDVANGRLNAGPQEIARMLLEFSGADARTPSFAYGNDDIVGLIRSIYLETIRENGRRHALSIQAA